MILHKQIADTTTAPQAGVQRAIAQLQSLNRLAQVISTTLDADKILQIILQEAITLTDSEQGSILSFSETEKRPMQTLFKSAEASAGQLLSGLSDLIGGWVLKNKTFLSTANLAEDSRFPRAKAWFPEVAAVLAVPMSVRNNVTGIIILIKPQQFTADEVELLNIVAAQCGQFLENARNYERVVQENQQLRRHVQKQYDFHGIIGASPKMLQVFELLQRISAGESRILIQGESGTGKELIARTIHYNGPRQERKFIAVDCGALPENLLESELFGHVKGAFTGAISDKKGLFDVAHRGTLFLDEISNTSLVFQAKLLRAIQQGEIKPVGALETHKVDVRIIAATSSSLPEKVTKGEFREDLYYRLNVITVQLPPLRERIEDIRLLADHFLSDLSEKSGKGQKSLMPATLRHLENHTWPGNIRELENVIERAVALALPDDRLIPPDLLPDYILQASEETDLVLTASRGKIGKAIDVVEKRMIQEALAKHDGSRTAAAKILGITRQTLIAKIKKYKL